MKRRVLVAFDQCELVKATLASCGGAEFCYVSEPNELGQTLAEFQPEIVFSIKGPRFNADAHRPIIDFSSVKWVQVGGSGYDHFLGWDRSRLTVTNCAGVLSNYLAETVTGAMIALNSNLFEYWGNQKLPMWMPGDFRPLSEQTILIVGLGQIGRCVARNAKALGMRVLAVRRTSQADDSSVDKVFGPDELCNNIGEADVVSVHLRLSSETEQLFDRNMFSAMKKGATFINTSRGKVVDEKALIEALQLRQVGKAYLDVFEHEPLPLDNPLWALDNVLLTPHCSDNVQGWPIKFAEFFVGNLNRWIDGQPLINEV